ncbi:MAG: spore coat associated protein CotJA [Clostridiales bacterium]|jgi:hypothetical protein|nr:spore coat associated protein CotJA [Clostridiales bacterium]
MFDYRNQPMTPESPSESKRRRPIPQKTALAQAYVPEQEFEDLYPPEQALNQGTAFRQLDMPYNKPGHTRR